MRATEILRHAECACRLSHNGRSSRSGRILRTSEIEISRQTKVAEEVALLQQRPGSNLAKVVPGRGVSPWCDGYWRGGRRDQLREFGNRLVRQPASLRNAQAECGSMGWRRGVELDPGARGRCGVERSQYARHFLVGAGLRGELPGRSRASRG